MSTINLIPLARPMGPRDPDESHRVASPLELFFDLVFVVAIASAAAELHHGLSAGHYDAVIGFVLVFFAIWWAWMNYAWFASAYDCDDVLYRLLTFTIMAGSLLLAAGVPDLFADGQSVAVVAGYAVMRLAMVALWLRVARGDHPHRTTAMTYAVGITVVQILWIARLALHLDLIGHGRLITWAYSYAHVPIFASVAAVGAALAAAVDVVEHDAAASPRAIAFALVVPIVVYAMTLSALHAAADGRPATVIPGASLSVVLLVIAALGLAMPLAVLLVGLTCAGAVVQHVVAAQRELAQVPASAYPSR